MGQLHSTPSSEVLSSVVYKLKSMFKKIFCEISKSSKPLLYRNIEENSEKKKSIFVMVKYYKCTSAITKFKIWAHSFPVESGRWNNITCEKRVCPLCLKINMKVMRSNICSNLKSKVGRNKKTLIPETNKMFTPYPMLTLSIDILHMILRGSSNVNYRVSQKKVYLFDEQ